MNEMYWGGCWKPEFSQGGKYIYSSAPGYKPVYPAEKEVMNFMGIEHRPKPQPIPPESDDQKGGE